MSLSAYERAQFERLTADFEISDPVALKKMARREKATAMSYVALPKIKIAWSSEVVTIMLLLLGFASIPVSLLFFILAHNFGAAIASLFVGGLLVSVSDAGLGSRKAGRKNRHL